MAQRFLRTFLATAAAILGLLAALPVLALTLPFWLVSGLTRWLSRCLEPEFLAWNEVFAFDREFGWRPRPHLNTHHLADDVFRVTTDENGWRGRSSVSDSQVVVLGDSFAWGHGIDDRHFFASVRPELGIKAVGSNGYSMVQELLWLERLAPMLRGKLVVWLAYYGNDLLENLMPHMHGYRRPFLREDPEGDGWTIVRSHLSPAPWPFVWRAGAAHADSHGKLGEACVPGFQAGRVYAACEHLIRRGRDLCRDAGATLVVMGVPDPVQLEPDGGRRLAAEIGRPEAVDVDYPDQRLAEICRDLAVKFVPLKGELTRAHYKATDCHWNERGHARIAAILADLRAEIAASDSVDGTRRPGAGRRYASAAAGR